MHYAPQTAPPTTESQPSAQAQAQPTRGPLPTPGAPWMPGGDPLAATPVVGLAAISAAMQPEARPPAESPMAASAKRTMIGVAMSDVVQMPIAQNVQSAPVPQTPQIPAPQERGAIGEETVRVSSSKTMLGVAIPGIAPLANAVPTPQPSSPYPAAPAAPQATSPQAPQASQASAMLDSSAGRSKTMLGVAIPGIAPIREPSAGSPAPMQPQLSNRSGTMVGVAVPGIAPVHPGMAHPGTAQPGMGAPPMAQPPHRVRPGLANTALSQAPILPMPAPFIDDEPPVPSVPRRRQKSGVPLAVVAGIIGGIVLVGGIVIALLYRGAPPISAQPRLDAQGNEELHLRCDNCKDGTVAELNGAKTTFHSGEADLALTKSLEVGDNPLTLHIDRPGVGRDEALNLVVPVAFRIRADLADIGAKPPVITVRVAAGPGTEVKVDGKPLALDPSGKGAYALDVSADTEGFTDELRVIDRKIPYTVTLNGGLPENGVVSARVAVAPLRLDSPSSHAVTDQATFMLAGRTQAGASITLNEKPASVSADGTFAQSFDAKTLGEMPIEIRTSAPSRAPRTAHITVKRVASLEAEARAVEAQSPLGFDAINADITSKIGQRAVIAGEVIEARTVGHQVIALIDDRRECAQRAAQGGPCLARVTLGEDAKIARGDVVRAYGRVLTAVKASNGKMLPDIEGDFVVKGRGPR
jgi:hypothetical protein